MDTAEYDDMFGLSAGSVQAACDAVIMLMHDRGFLGPEDTVEAAFVEAAFGVGFGIGFQLCMGLSLAEDPKPSPQELAEYAIDTVVDRPVRVERLTEKMVRFSIDHGLPEGTTLGQMRAHRDWDWAAAPTGWRGARR